jgi:NAD(P)-dependent dehydrogenase (short-subunit alcohol dehydrogenase family)
MCFLEVIQSFISFFLPQNFLFLGIGRAACVKFAQQGMHVWMVDIDEQELIMAVDKVKLLAAASTTATTTTTTDMRSSQRIEYRVVDVSDYQAMTQLADQVFDDTNHNSNSKHNDGNYYCHILMNNAGIGQGGNAMTSLPIVQHVMNVNLYGPIHGCLALVPKMITSQQPGIVINTGSKQGITMPPGNLSYNMSKAALKVFTEGLEHDFMLQRRRQQQQQQQQQNNEVPQPQLRAALLIPGWVNTSIVLKAMRAKNDKDKDDDHNNNDNVPFHEDKPAAGAWMPQQVVDFMIEQLDLGRFYIVCPDHDVSRQMDDLRMMWTMQDITQNRPPLSRWHPDYQDAFNQYVQANNNNNNNSSSSDI